VPHPALQLRIESIEEKMMEHPYVIIGVHAEPVVYFQVLEEGLPLGNKDTTEFHP
jgi:hypothetical protein